MYQDKDFKNRFALVSSIWACYFAQLASAQSSDASQVSNSATDAATDVATGIQDNLPGSLNNLIDSSTSDAEEFINAHQWIISILMIAFGIFYLFFGWKLYKILVWINGAVLGFALFQMLTLTIVDAANPQMDLDTAQWIGFGVGIVGGLIGGALALFLKALGLALVGAAFGYVVGYNLDLVIQKLCFDSGVKDYPEWASWIVYIGCAVIFALLVACFQKPLVITFTAGIGSFLTLASIGGLTGTWPAGFSGNQAIDWSDYTVWGWFGGMIVLWIVGMVVQFKIYGNVEHDTHESVPQKASV